MRKYTAEDMFNFVDILSSIAGSSGNSLATLLRPGSGNVEMSDEEAEARGIELVLYVLNKSYEGAKDKVIKFLASLSEMSVKEFLAQDPEVVLDLIEEIATREDSKRFFSKVSVLYKKIGSTENTTNIA